MTRTMTDFARSCAQFPDQLAKAQARGVQRSALHVTGSVRDEIRAATGDMRLSGVGRRGARVGARYDVKGTVNPTALIRATGPLQLIERDTQPHEIRPKRRRRGKKAVLKIGTGFVSGPVRHPGTRGKRPFAKGVDKTKHSAPLTFNAEIEIAMRQTFRVS